MKVAIQRLSLASLGRMGCLLGAVAAFLPSLLCGVGGYALVVLAGRWLEAWQPLPIPILDRDIFHFDLVSLLGLEGVLDLLQKLAAASVPGWLLVVLVMALIAGAILAAIIMLTGLAYNLLAAATGGVVAEMRPVAPRKDPPARDRT